MSNRLYALPKTRPRQLSGGRITSSLRKAKRHCVSAVLGLMLLAVVMLLGGCHTLPTKPCPEHKLPTPPALSLQAPKVSYSISAQTNIEAWRKMLTEQSQTGKP